MAVDAQDAVSGQLELSVVVPACVMQAVTPQLLGAGLLDRYELRQPLTAWVPTVADAGFNPQDPEVCTAVNARIQSAARESLAAFSDAAEKLAFPGDALPVLPMGVYVRFRLRCTVDSLAAGLQGMSGAAGVAELKASLASVLASVLASWGRTSPESLPALGPGRRVRRGQGRGRP